MIGHRLRYTPILLLMLILLITLSGTSAEQSDHYIIIEEAPSFSEKIDPSLRKAIIAEEHMEVLVKLTSQVNTGRVAREAARGTSPGRHRRDAAGPAVTNQLQAVNLRELNLRRNEISDLAPLHALEKLEKLNLADNKISDLSALNGAVLSSLRHLDLSINEIDDLSALHWDRLENLSHLDIRFNYIRLQDEETADLLRNLEARGVEILAEPMY